MIVPVYNVEKYIGKCLSSIKAQSFTDFEVIVVNDGTPDGSMDIARQFAKDDPRFRLFDKENGGLSDARNFGIRQARGEYIAFVDSDDYLHPDYLKTLYGACEDSGADMSICRYLFSYRDGKFFSVWLFAARPRVVGRDKGIKMLIRDVFIQNMAWNKLYRRSLFIGTGIEYPDMYYEDIATSERLLSNGNKLAITGKYLYYYAIHRGSITQTRNAKLINDYMRSLLVVCNHVRYIGEYKKFASALRFAAGKVYLANFFQVLGLHIAAGTFRGMGRNLGVIWKNTAYLFSDELVPSDGIPELPYRLEQPEKRQKK